MRFFLPIVIFIIVFAEFHLPGNAEVKIDEALKQNFSYINDVPVLKPDAPALLLLELAKQKDSTSSKATPDKPQCFATNKQFINCLH